MVRGKAKADAQMKNAAKAAAQAGGNSTKGVDIGGANAAAVAERAKKREVKEAADKLVAEKKAREEAKKLKEAKLAEKEKQKAAKASGGGGDGLADLEKKLMPLVKQGDGLVADGKVAEGLAKFQEAMDGFRAAGHKRPKLKEKIDDAKATLSQPEPEAA